MNLKVNNHNRKRTVWVLGIPFLPQADKWASFTGDIYNLDNLFVVIFIYKGAESAHACGCLHACEYAHACRAIFKRETIMTQRRQCTAIGSFHNIKAVIHTVETLPEAANLFLCWLEKNPLLNRMQEWSSILLLIRKLEFLLHWAELAIVGKDLLRWQAFPELRNVVGQTGTQMFRVGNI